MGAHSVYTPGGGRVSPLHPNLSPSWGHTESSYTSSWSVDHEPEANVRYQGVTITKGNSSSLFVCVINWSPLPKVTSSSLFVCVINWSPLPKVTSSSLFVCVINWSPLPKVTSSSLFVCVINWSPLPKVTSSSLFGCVINWEGCYVVLNLARETYILYNMYIQIILYTITWIVHNFTYNSKYNCTILFLYSLYLCI